MGIELCYKHQIPLFYTNKDNGIIITNTHTHLYIFESYIRQAPRPPQLFIPHFKHVESMRAPKYTGAGIPPPEKLHINAVYT